MLKHKCIRTNTHNRRHMHASVHAQIHTMTDIHNRHTRTHRHRQIINLLNYNEDKVMLIPHNIKTADIADVIESLVINVMI